MTVTLTRPAPAAYPTPPPLTAPPPAARKAVPVGVSVLCSVMLLLMALVFAFLAYLFGFSRLSEAHDQSALLKTFRHSLGQAIAPVGPANVGDPVAVLDIPRIGIHNVVVVEGTDARRLTEGPGHRRDTVLPGQAGVSVLYGRREMFGAPFTHLLRLQVGDTVTVDTGQGVSTYRVSSFGTGDHPAPANADNRLVLTTSDGNGTVSVSADLVTPPQPAPGGLPARAKDETAMATSADISVLPLMLWTQLLLMLSIVGTVAAVRWSRWPAFLCVAPLLVAVLWNVFENAATLLPNLY